MTSIIKTTKRVKKIKRIKRKRILKSELINSLVPLPYCGEIIPDCCNALKKNRGLYTQCKKLKQCKHEYCSSCLDSARNHSTGKPPYGDIRDRDKLKEDNMLQGILSYCDIMDKLNVTRYEAERDAARMGWNIPEMEWITSKKKRGRPKKKKIPIIFVEDSEEEGEKPSTKIERRISDDDILAALLARSSSV
jgi:hypothetical protein